MNYLFYKYESVKLFLQFIVQELFFIKRFDPIDRIGIIGIRQARAIQLQLTGQGLLTELLFPGGCLRNTINPD